MLLVKFLFWYFYCYNENCVGVCKGVFLEGCIIWKIVDRRFFFIEFCICYVLYVVFYKFKIVFYRLECGFILINERKVWMIVVNGCLMSKYYWS